LPDLFPLNEARKLGEQVHGRVRRHPQLLAEIAALREPLGLFAMLRDLMYDDSTARHPVASSGHIVHRNADAAGEKALLLLVMAGDPDGGLVDRPHDDPANEDLDAMASDNAVGNGPGIETINFDADPADFHRHDVQDAAGVTSTLAPPVAPSVETQPGNAASSLTPRSVPDGPVNPVAAASIAAPPPFTRRC